MSLAEDLSALAQQLAPESCPRCGQMSQHGFCQDCKTEFRRVLSPCPRCGLPGPCRNCPAAAASWQVDSVMVPFIYGPPLSGFVQALKYARQRHLGLDLGRLLAAELESRGASCGAIVPVPLHPRRLRERRYNQADEIARPIARCLQVPLLPALVTRPQATEPQAGLNRRQRWRSVRKAFSVARQIEATHIAIVDDVVTTGATINAIAGQLKLAGAASISAWAVARAVDDGSAQNQPVRNR